MGRAGLNRATFPVVFLAGVLLSAALPASAATYEPGGPGVVGTMTFTGELVLAPSTILNYDLVTPGASDLINITGALTLDGTVHVAGSYVPGDYTLITYTPGMLTDHVLTPPPNGAFSYTVDVTTPGSVILKVASNSTPGDVNGD